MKPATVSRLRLYNPHDSDQETLAALSVGRESLIEEIVADLGRQSHDKVRQPWLIHAPRGLGKTHLMALLDARLRRDPELASKFIPLWIAESDAYATYDMRTLLKVVLERLESVLSSQPDAVKRIQAAIDSDELARRTDCLVAEAKAAGRTFVVLLENFDALAMAFDRSPASRESKALRRMLVQSENPIFVFTTAHERVDSIDSPSKPMHQLFRSRRLKPLDEAQAAELLRRLRDRIGARNSVDSGEARSWDRARVRLFHRLTGGSPRSIIIAFTAISVADGIGALVEELESLLDEHTPTFEQRLADLAPRERAIVAAMASAPRTLTLREIAKASGLPERSLSTQIDRLESSGWVGPVYDTGGKGALYDLQDGLFRLWFQYRRRARLLLPLVEFLAMWYEPEELQQWLEMHYVAADSGEEAENAARRYLMAAVERSASPAIQAERASMLRACALEASGPARGVRPSGLESDESPEGGDKLRSSRGERISDLVDAATAARLAGRLTQALAFYDEVLRQAAGRRDERSAVQVARALVGRGLTYGALGDLPAERASYLEVVQLFGDRQESALAEEVAKALINLAVVYGEANETIAELKGYDEIRRRFGDRPEGAIVAQVARASVNRALALGAAGDRAAEQVAYEEVLAKWSRRPEPEIEVQVARALIGRGFALQAAGESGAACASFDLVTSRYSDQPDLELAEQVAWAFLGRAAIQTLSGDPQAAVASCDEVVRRYSARGEEELAALVARALFNRACSEIVARDRGTAVATFDEVVRRYGDKTDIAFAEHVASALVGLGMAHSALRDMLAAIAACDEVVRRYGERTEPELVAQVVEALLLRGRCLYTSDDPLAALASFDEVVARYSERTEDELIGHVAAALYNRGAIHGQRRNVAAELANYEEVIDRYGERTGEEIAQWVAKAFLGRGMVQFAASGREAASVSFDEVVNRYAGRNEPVLAELVARAVFLRLLLGCWEGDAERVRREYGVYVSVTHRVPASRRPDMSRVLDETLTLFEPSRVRAWLEPMRASTDQAHQETARLFDYVIDIVEASMGEHTARRRSGQARDAQVATARVPGELRATVRKRAQSILSARRRAAKQSVAKA